MSYFASTIILILSCFVRHSRADNNAMSFIWNDTHQLGVNIHLDDAHTCIVSEEDVYLDHGRLLRNGTIRSVIDPKKGTYLPSQYCWARIRVPLGSVIKISFRVEMETRCLCKCDYFAFSKNGYISASLGRLSNLVFCEDQRLMPDKSNFRVHTFVEYADFVISTDSKEEPSTGLTMSWREERPLNACSEIYQINDQSGYISIPKEEDGRYLPSQCCYWRFTAAADHVWEFSFVSLSMTKPSIPCTEDKIHCTLCPHGRVTLYEIKAPKWDEHDGKPANRIRQVIMTTRCGTIVPSLNFTSTSADVFAGYIGADQLIEIREGFQLFYRQVPKSCQETHVLIANSAGVLNPTLDETTGHYRPNQKCGWLLSIPKMAIRLSLTHFDLGQCFDKNNCDVISVYDGESSDAPLFFSRNSSWNASTTITDKSNIAQWTSSGSSIFITLKTDRFYEGTGFNITYEPIDSDHLPCQKTTTILVTNVQPSGIVRNHIKQSPPVYRQNEDCGWHLVAEAGRRLRLNLTHLDMETCGNQDTCPCDSLALYDGRDRRALELAMLCGQLNDTRSHTFTTSSSEAFVVFRTDRSEKSATGFQVEYESIVVIEPRSENEKTFIGLFLATVLPATVILILTVMASSIYIWRKRTLRHNAIKDDLAAWSLNSYIQPAANFNALLIEMGLESFCSEIKRLNINEEWLDFSETEQLGQGQFGVVMKGRLVKPEHHVPIIIAVKKAKSSRAEDLVDFIREAITISHFEHENVLILLGIAIIRECPHIVLPFMANGNLANFLRKARCSPSTITLDNHALNGFCQQICRGMAYITEKGFVHRDLAARNVLVSEKLQMKVCDFGFARGVEGSQGYYSWQGEDHPVPIRWHPLESLLMHYFDAKSDVWSFGVVCWEVFSFCETQPYFGLENTEIAEFLCKGNRLKKPEQCSEDFFQSVMLMCWREDRRSRPSFAELLQNLESS